MDLEIVELINVPMFDDTECYIVSTVSNDKIKNNYKKLHLSSYTTSSVPIKNHRVKFGSVGIHKTEFRLQAQSSSKSELLSDKWLCVSFMLKHENHHELLGTLTLNLTEYVNSRNKQELRFLLENSKTNTIVKLNLLICHLDHDENITYQTSRERQSPRNIQSPNLMNLSSPKSTSAEISKMERKLSLTRTRTPQSSLASSITGTRTSQSSLASSLNNNSNNSNNQQTRIPSPKVQKGIGSILDHEMTRNNSISIGNYNTTNGSIPSPRSSKSFLMSPIKVRSRSTNGISTTTKNNINNNNNLTKLNEVKEIDTQLLMNKACESAVNDVSLLDELINKTYRFTWQLRTTEYEEYTPSECVKDIIEKNGNGWKKNDEGIDMVDVVENEFKESTLMHRNRSSLFSYSNNNNNDNSDNNNINNKNSNNNDSDNNNNSSDSNSKKTYLDVFEEFKNVERLVQGSDDDDSDEDGEFYNKYGNNLAKDNSKTTASDIFDAYYKGNGHNSSKAKRYKPLSESEVREDLRSWHITVK